MNDTAANANEVPKPITSSSKKIVSVCVLLFAVRIYLSWVEKHRVAAQDFSWPATLATILGVVVISFAAAMITQRWFGKVVSFLSAIVFGAVASVHFVSPIGAFIGGVVGFVVVFEIPRKCFWIAMRWFVRYGLWSLAVGIFAGCLFVSNVVVQDRSIQVASILGGLSFFLLVVTIWVSLKRRQDTSRLKRVYAATCNFLAAFLTLIVGWILGVEAVNQYAYIQLNKVGGAGYGPALPSRWLTHGMTVCDYVWISENATDDSMKALRNMRSMTGITIESELVTDEGFKFLEPNTQLEWISIRNANITNEALAAFASSRSLYSLNIANLPIGDEAVEHLGSNRRLNQLRLSGTKITDRSIKTIGKYASLQYLTLSETAISDEGLAHLTTTRLSTIDLSRTKIRGPGLEYLAKLPALNWLNLSNTDLDSKYIELLSSSTISRLSLNGIKIDKPAVDGLLKLRRLSELRISHSEISDEQAKRLPPIARLTIDCVNLTPSTVQAFAQQQMSMMGSTELELRLDDQHLTPELVERMSQFGVQVACSNCTVDLAAVEAIEKYSDTIDLHFRNLKIDDELHNRLNRAFGVVIGSRATD